MKWAVVVAVALLLVGCTKSVSEMSYTELKEYTAQLVERCQKQGVPPAEIEACAMQEMRSDQAKRQRQREIGEAIAAAGESYSRSAQANRPVNCTSTGYGNTVRTTCY